MKMLVRASILTVAAAGLIAGFAPNHSAQAQAQALSHQVTSQIIGNPTAGCALNPKACQTKW